MIVIFHLIYVMASSLLSVISNSMLSLPCTKSGKHHKTDDIVEPSVEGSSKLNTKSAEVQAVPGRAYVQDAEPIEGLTFVPPVYAQRYMAVQEILKAARWKGNLKKVVDFGCAEFGFFTYVKNVPGVEEILTVDIDEELLKHCKCRCAPLTSDYLSNRETPLRVRIFAGSIANLDRCLLGTDAVICIEIIEHLWPNEVEAVPYTVFGFIKPRVAIFTTPNSDFNVLFTNFTGFRHLDHKFEWSRDQFHCWATNIASRYPDYEVSFQGIGAGPPGTEAYGHCSQMAVFVKRESSLASQREEEGNDVFTEVCDYEYPFRVDGRTNDEKILHEAEYHIRVLGLNDDYCHDDGVTEVPICSLLPFVEKWCTSKEKLITILESNNWKMSVRDPNTPAVIYPYFNGEDCSSCGEDNYDDEEPTDLILTDHLNKENVQAETYEDDWNWDSTSEKNDVGWGDEIEVNSSYSAERLENGTDGSESKQQIISSLPFDWEASQSSRITSDQKLKLNIINSAIDISIDKIDPFIQSENREIIENNKACPSRSIAEGDVATPVAQHSYNDVTNGLHDDSGNEKKHIAMDSCFSELDAPSSSTHSCMNKSLSSKGSNGSYSYETFPTTCSQEMSESLVVNFSESGNTINDLDVDSSSDDCNYVDNSRSEQDMDLDLSLDQSDNSLSDDSQERVIVDNHANRIQHHRNHFPFGLNDIVVENGDVANNNRDGEGNNAVAIVEELIEVDVGLFDDDMLDEDDDFNDDDEDEDFENDNEPLIPNVIDVNDFPDWLLNLIVLVHHGGPQRAGAGEPNGHM